MQQLFAIETEQKLSERAEQILADYPEWREAALEALSQKRWPSGKEPAVVEVYDQEGLLSGMLYDHVYSPDVEADRTSAFQAWFYEGRLVAMYTTKELIVDRLPDPVPQ